MAELIFAEMSAVCEAPPPSLDFLRAFLANLRTDRIYTTKYDLLLQAAPDVYTGFQSAQRPDGKSFDRADFWHATDSDSLFHLHGPVHLAFGRPAARDALSLGLGEEVKPSSAWLNALFVPND
jgi:hypothetical protein